MKTRAKILAVGEVLWDVFPDGPRFGGAPANFACHAAALGAAVTLASRVGADDLGAAVRHFLTEQHVDTQVLQTDPLCATGTVDVQLGAAGTPMFTIRQNVAWDHLQSTPELERLARHADVICFGTLAQRSPTTRRTIMHLVRQVAENRLRLLDLNLRDPFFDASVIEESLGVANALKLNEDELAIVGDMLGLGRTEADRLVNLQQRYGLRLIALTRGADGSCLMTADQHSDREGGEDIQIVDTVGAGDSFTAAMTVGYLAGKPLDEIHDWASAVASFVCGQAGAVPTLPPNLRGQ